MIRQTVPRRRLGFTLIELLVVLVIIGILMALLVPAIGAAMRKARGAAVQAEINQMAQALADFKSKFGDYPPSRIAIREDGAYDGTDTTVLSNGATNDVKLGTLYLRGATAIRKFWPRVNVNSGAAVFPKTSTVWYDYNGDGVFAGNSSVFVLEGHECLVFFLGGIAQPNGSGGYLGMTGFGKNPSNPFSNNSPGNSMYNQNRNPPLIDFDAGRLLMPPTSTSKMPTYVDSLNATNSQASAFYSYFSTNNGSGYDPNDVNGVETDNNAISPITLTYKVSQSPGTSASPSPNPYTTGPPSGVSTVGYINPQSFQILSSGIDGVFGLGGYYNPTSSTGALPPETAISNSTDPLVRVFEKDNLTNFHNGTLD